MPRVVVRPERLDLDSPGRRDYWLALEHDSIWGDHLLPLTVLVGPKVREGEGLVAFGSNHGNEYEGPIAIKHLLREIKIDDVMGRVILMPVLNPSAFLAGTRESSPDDRVNLNRAFVEGAGTIPSLSGITHRIAAFVRQYIWPRVHIVLDLHSAGMWRGFLCVRTTIRWMIPSRVRRSKRRRGGLERRRLWSIRTRHLACYRVKRSGWERSRLERNSAGGER